MDPRSVLRAANFRCEEAATEAVSDSLSWRVSGLVLPWISGSPTNQVTAWTLLSEPVRRALNEGASRA
jgi:hypothetical protein